MPVGFTERGVILKGMRADLEKAVQEYELRLAKVCLKKDAIDELDTAALQSRATDLYFMSKTACLVLEDDFSTRIQESYEGIQPVLLQAVPYLGHRIPFEILTTAPLTPKEIEILNANPRFYSEWITPISAHWQEQSEPRSQWGHLDVDSLLRAHPGRV